MMTPEQERILGKIKKCMALSASSEPHEAAAALRQAQALMAKYGISEAAVSMPSIKTTKLRSAAVSRPKDYEIGLINAIVKAFGCMVWYKSGSSHGFTADQIYGQYAILGPEHQVAVAHYTADVLFRRLAKARTEYNKTLGRSSNAEFRRFKAKALDSFCVGWVVEVTVKVQEFANPPEVDAELKRIYADNLGYKTYEETKDPKACVKPKKLNHHDARSVLAGQLAGSQESIHRPMEARAAETQKYLTN